MASKITVPHFYVMKFRDITVVTHIFIDGFRLKNDLTHEDSSFFYCFSFILFVFYSVVFD